MRDRHETQTRSDGQNPNAYPPGLLDMIEAVTNWTARTGVATNWRSDTVVTVPGESRPIVQENKQRSNLKIFTDPANTVPVWISSAPINGNPAGVSRNAAVQLAAGSAVLEMTHAGPVYYWSSAAAVVYVVAEYLA